MIILALRLLDEWLACLQCMLATSTSHLVSGISCWGFLWAMFSSGHLFWLISHDLHVLVGCVVFEQSALCGEGHFCSQSLPTDPSQSSLSGNYVIVLFLLLLLLKSLLSLYYYYYYYHSYCYYYHYFAVLLLYSIPFH